MSSVNSIEGAINGRHLEMEAKAQILPGMLLERYEDGVRPHSVEGGTAPPLIAMENRFNGTDIHTPYEMNDVVYLRYCLPGDVFWGRLSTYIPGVNRFLWSVGVLEVGYLVIAGSNPDDGALIGRELEVVSLPSYGFFVRVEVL